VNQPVQRKLPKVVDDKEGKKDKLNKNNGEDGEDRRAIVEVGGRR